MQGNPANRALQEYRANKLCPDPSAKIDREMLHLRIWYETNNVREDDGIQWYGGQSFEA